MIELCKENLSRELFEDMQFFMYAEVGAMGERGAVNFVKADGTLYHFNYVYGTIDEADVESYYTMPKREDGWQYVSLGYGNHLFVRQELYPKFYELIKDYTHKGYIYKNWIQHAETILSERKGAQSHG